MQRKMTDKGRASRERLLHAASEQFATRGYAATKVSDIVKAAGLTQAAFYLYFPSKEAILQELVSQFLSEFRELGNSGQNVTALPPSEVPEQVGRNVEAVLQFLSRNPELTKIALYDSPEREQILRQLVSSIVGNLRRNQEAGHVRADVDPEVMAECMVGMMDRVTVRCLLDGENNPVELASDLTRILLGGILARQELRSQGSK